MILCIGGPALIYYVTPTEEEIRKRYNPDLRRRSEETRLERQERFDAFASKMKEYARSDRPSKPPSVFPLFAEALVGPI